MIYLEKQTVINFASIVQPSLVKLAMSLTIMYDSCRIVEDANEVIKFITDRPEPQPQLSAASILFYAIKIETIHMPQFGLLMAALDDENVQNI